MNLVQQIIKQETDKYVLEFLKSAKGKIAIKKCITDSIEAYLDEESIDNIVGLEGSKKFYNKISEAVKKEFGL